MKTIFVSGDKLRHFADSAQQRNGHAWFVRDTTEEWVATVCPAIKISRLGTHIAEKFAGRYYEKFFAVSIFLPADAAESPAEAAERYFISDAAYCIGEGVSAGEEETVHEIAEGGQTLRFSSGSLGVGKVIAELSKFATLKMGDIIIFGAVRIASMLNEGGRLEVSIDGERSIDLRIK